MVHIWQKALLQMQNKFKKSSITLGFLVFIIFEDLSLLFSNLKVCQKQVRSLYVGLNLEEVVNILDIVDLNQLLQNIILMVKKIGCICT